MIFSENLNLQNLKKTDGGYLITNSDLIILANYIKDLQEENINLSNQVKVLENSLNSEREKTKETIEEKNKLISNLEDQIKNYKKIESYNSLSIIEKLFYITIGVGASQLFLFITK
jgi:uncharacterized protein YlxW (UPF0749 family)